MMFGRTLLKVCSLFFLLKSILSALNKVLFKPKNILIFPKNICCRFLLEVRILFEVFRCFYYLKLEPVPIDTCLILDNILKFYAAPSPLPQ